MNTTQAIAKHAVSFKNTPMPTTNAIELGMQKIAYRNKRLAHHATRLNSDITEEVRRLAELDVKDKFV